MRRSLALCSLPIAAGKVYFSETFGDGWENRWVQSQSTKEKWGRWQLATGKWFGDEAEDQGLQTAETMKYYAIAAPFPSFDNEGKTLYIQYQVKYEKDLSCGGGYLKMGPTPEDLTKFGEDTPYSIMFGPDQCNAEKRTHLIFSFAGKNYLKKEELPFKQEGEGVAHLYRLVVNPDNTVRVEVDEEKIYEGSLTSDWDMLPDAEIVNPDDKKPKDWVDEAKIPDPEDSKPVDWVDEKRIEDADSKKPEEWDDEEDGEYEAPMIDNPEFKGEWKGKKIKNPEFIGKWEATKIPNPDFVDSPNLYKYDLGFLGFDVWQVKGGTIFDNIIVTDSVDEADGFAQKWKTLNASVEGAKKKEEDANSEAFEKFRAARAKKIVEMEAADALKASEKGSDPDLTGGGGGGSDDIDPDLAGGGGGGPDLDKVEL